MATIPSITTDEFVKEVNAARRANKDKWYQWAGVVNGKEVKIKAYNTWLQIFRIDGLQANTVGDISVAKFNECLRSNVQ